MGQCNAGHLVQSLTGLSDRQISETANHQLDEWTEHARTFCENTGSPVDDLFHQVAAYGLDYQSIIHLENLSDKDVLENLEGGFRYLRKNSREDVVSYMENMANLLRKELKLLKRLLT